MMAQIEFYGVYFPTLLPLLLIAFSVTSLIRMALSQLGMYRYIWHRALFNLALYLTVLGAAVLITLEWNV